MQFNEKEYIRDLAKIYIEIASNPIQEERRLVWRNLNSLKRDRPPVFVRAYAWREMPEATLKCTTPLMRELENSFQRAILHSKFGDDFVIEPWLTILPVYEITGWGVEYERHFAHNSDSLEAFKVDYAIKDINDISMLRRPEHKINEPATREKYEKICDLLDDILTIDLSRCPCYKEFSGDLSTDLGYLRGMENFMLDMYDNPEGLHRLMKFMADGVLAVHDQAEKAGDWSFAGSDNQGMIYSQELDDPKPNMNGINRDRIWGFFAAQEFTMVSPEMHEEFLLNYQLPIMAKFGLVAYGCCEDLSGKIAMLRKVPNLRRIAASPMADLARCVEQIGQDYVVSYRPSPADMLSYNFDPERCRKIFRHDLALLKDSFFDITMKDVQTVDGGLKTIQEWVKIAREELDS